MLKRIFLFTTLAISLVAASQILSEKIADAAAVAVADQTGTFTISTGGNDITIQASTGVYMSINEDDDTNTTSATVSAVHAKGERNFAMDSDGGPLYYISVAAGTTSPTVALSVTGSDDFSGVGAWTEL